MILDGDDEEVGNPRAAAPAPSEVNGIPGVTVVPDPLVFGGAAQIPGFGQAPLPPDGTARSQSLVALPRSQPVTNVVSQVMSPNAGLPQQTNPGERGILAPGGHPTAVPVQATQERVRGVRPDGTPWEAQRVNIIWQHDTASEQLRGEVQRLGEMLHWTQTTRMDRDLKIEEFMTTAAERLKEFSAKVEEEFGKEKAHIQMCIDAWVRHFLNRP